MKESKADVIDASPSQIHQETVPQGAKSSEGSMEFVGVAREPYGPGGMYSETRLLVLSCPLMNDA